MDALTHGKAMEAFCRQRARMEGEVANFWLAEADLWRERVLALARKTKPIAENPRASSPKKTARRSGRAA
jgi:hypothetical protein